MTEFKKGDLVKWCGIIGHVHHDDEDLIEVEFRNVEPDSEYRHKYLVFDKCGRKYNG